MSEKEYVMQLVKAGKQLAATKFLMEQTNVSLREAHDLIETWTNEADNISGFKSQEYPAIVGVKFNNKQLVEIRYYSDKFHNRTITPQNKEEWAYINEKCKETINRYLQMIQYSGQRPEKQNKPRKSRTGLKIILSLFLIIISSSLLLYAIVTDRLVFHGNRMSLPIELLYIPIIALVLMWIPSDIKRRSAGQKWLFGIIFFFILILLIFGGIFGMVFLVSHFK
jgi:hypothetical protein